MKKFIFFMLTVITCYFAAMYRYLPLLALAVMQLLLCLLLFGQVQYCGRRMAVEFSRSMDYMEKGSGLWCRILVHNQSRLPVGSFQLRIRFGYRHEEVYRTKRLYASAKCGEDSLDFSVCPPYCGIVKLQMTRLRNYDYLSLFSHRVHLAEEMSIAVFPEPRTVSLTFSSQEGAGSLKESVTAYNGDASGEIRQVREYRPGDSSRYVHWKLSAREESLYLKEYEKERNLSVDLFLDLTDAWNASADEMGRFYELTAALIRGFLEEAAEVRVLWNSGGQGQTVVEVLSEKEQCNHLLLRLYQEEPYEEDQEETITETMKEAMKGGKIFSLDTALRWYYDEKLIYHFSGEMLTDELEEKSFVL